MRDWGHLNKANISLYYSCYHNACTVLSVDHPLPFLRLLIKLNRWSACSAKAPFIFGLLVSVCRNTYICRMQLQAFRMGFYLFTEYHTLQGETCDASQQMKAHTNRVHIKAWWQTFCQGTSHYVNQGLVSYLARAQGADTQKQRPCKSCTLKLQMFSSGKQLPYDHLQGKQSAINLTTELCLGGAAVSVNHCFHNGDCTLGSLIAWMATASESTIPIAGIVISTNSGRSGVVGPASSALSSLTRSLGF